MNGRTAIFALAMIAAGASTAFAGCGGLQSSPSSQPADIKFINGTTGKVNVLWYKFQGGTRMYRSLAPKQSYVQATFTNHVWAFTDAKGKCISTYVVKGSGTYTIP